jgi:hypothetical protein
LPLDLSLSIWDDPDFSQAAPTLQGRLPDDDAMDALARIPHFHR